MESAAHRQYFVGGNWKCNGTQAFLKTMIEGTMNAIEYNHDRVCKTPLINLFL